MADFHLGQHLLFRRHAYTVTCHLAPGALRRPTLPPRDGPPFCSVLKMISMHEISWGAHKLFPLLCIPVWIFPRSVSVNVCAARARVVPGSMFECAYCSSARACVFNGGFARCRGEYDLNGDIRCPFCVWNCSALLLSLRRTLIAFQSVCGVYSKARLQGTFARENVAGEAGSEVKLCIYWGHKRLLPVPPPWTARDPMHINIHKLGGKPLLRPACRSRQTSAVKNTTREGINNTVQAATQACKVGYREAFTMPLHQNVKSCLSQPMVSLHRLKAATKQLGRERERQRAKEREGRERDWGCGCYRDRKSVV